MSNVIEVSEANFEAEVLQSPKPVLVDFWAPWCMPCRVLHPVVEELANENADSIKVVKINVDDAMQLSATYDVSGIPTLLLFKSGEVVDRFVGLKSKSWLQAAINQVIG